ncbi:HAD family hydrolase [Nonomuraea sp. LPB2021202275-12-8]|uniref:HAD family hydrolase n=1 Tax=Nonomuraea sp. LPB2021202275-12-8 TaxID=3120159 RepID=UPI00300C8718
MPSDLPTGEALQAVLFDMDGTLVDTEPLWWQATASVARTLGFELGPADTPHVLGHTVEDTAAHLLSARPPSRPAESTTDLIRLLTESFARRVERSARVMPGAPDLLHQLSAARLPTALVSASPRSIVDLVLPRLGHRFDHVVAAEDTARGKPYPDPYLEAARRLGADPGRCVAVEDSPTGITAATAAGCRVLAVTPEDGLPSLRQIRER